MQGKRMEQVFNFQFFMLSIMQFETWSPISKYILFVLWDFGEVCHLVLGLFAIGICKIGKICNLCAIRLRDSVHQILGRTCAQSRSPPLILLGSGQVVLALHDLSSLLLLFHINKNSMFVFMNLFFQLCSTNCPIGFAYLRSTNYTLL